MRVHDNAFYALMRADGILADSTYEGIVANRPNRYASVFPREIREQRRYSGGQDAVTNEYIVHSVGTTPEQAKLVREHVVSAVLNKTPNAAGWRSRWVTFVTSQPLAMDDDAGTPLWYCVDVFQYDSEPA